MISTTILPFVENTSMMTLVYYANTDKGAFFVYDKSGKTYKSNRMHQCREIAAGSSFFGEVGSKWGFYYPKLDIALVNEFFVIVKKRLRASGVNMDSARITFYPTNMLDSSGKTIATVIEPSPFWRESSVRIEMFTLFLRCAAVYYPQSKGDFEKALASYDLLMTARSAVDLFLKGHVHCAFRFGGNMVAVLGRKDIVAKLPDYLTRTPVPTIPVPPAPPSQPAGQQVFGYGAPINVGVQAQVGAPIATQAASNNMAEIVGIINGSPGRAI